MQYNPALDGLRAVAVLTVVAFHCRTPLALGGYIGVDVFFVLSGYLITSILREEVVDTGSVSLKRFYWRRALRLWPPLLLMLAGHAVFARWAFPANNVVLDALVAATYSTDYFMAFFWRQPWSVSHTWSLAVEEHFYLIWPLFIVATRSLSIRSLVWVLVAAFTMATVWRIADALLWQDWYRTYYRFDTRMSGLVLGALIAVVDWRPERRTAEMIGRLSVYVLICAVVLFRFRSVLFIAWGGIIADLAAAALILSILSTRDSAIYRFLSKPSLVYLGALSYSIYLWHYPLALFAKLELDSSLLLLAIVAPFSIAIAALSFEFVEKPLKSMRRRMAPENAI